MQEKLISVRTSNEVVAGINRFVNEHQVWTGNRVIHLLLEAIFRHVPDGDIYSLLTKKEIESVRLDIKTKDLGQI